MARCVSTEMDIGMELIAANKSRACVKTPGGIDG